jgi:hypothetical protein
MVALVASDDNYNCFAHATGNHSYRDDNGLRLKHYCDKLANLGYIKLDQPDCSLCPGFEKVALYGYTPQSADYHNKFAQYSAMLPVPPPGFDFDDWLAIATPRHDDGLFMHASLQENDGTWTSKLGAGPLLRVRHPQELAGGDYGEIIAVFIRPRKTAVHSHE